MKRDARVKVLLTTIWAWGRLAISDVDAFQYTPKQFSSSSWFREVIERGKRWREREREGGGRREGERTGSKERTIMEGAKEKGENWGEIYSISYRKEKGKRLLVIITSGHSTAPASLSGWEETVISLQTHTQYTRPMIVRDNGGNSVDIGTHYSTTSHKEDKGHMNHPPNRTLCLLFLPNPCTVPRPSLVFRGWGLIVAELPKPAMQYREPQILSDRFQGSPNPLWQVSVYWI